MKKGTSGVKRLSQAEANRKVGFDVVEFTRKAKNQLKMGKVSLKFGKGIQASAEHDGRGTCIITLPTRKNIQKKLGLNATQTTLKLKTAILEENCHCKNHETLHSKAVVGCTIHGIKRNLTKQEQKNPFVRQKIAGLLSAKKQGK